MLARNSAGNNLNKNKTDHTWVQQDEAGVKCRLLAPVDPAIIQRGPMAKREERGMPSQVYVLRKHREMHVSEAEPCTTSTNQHDGPVIGGSRFIKDERNRVYVVLIHISDSHIIYTAWLLYFRLFHAKKSLKHMILYLL